MSAPRAPKTLTHAPAPKPKPAPPRASRRSAVPAGVDAEGISPWASSPAVPFGEDRAAAPAWASCPAAPFGMAGPAAIQLKPVIGAADDPYEREADRVADHVVSGPASARPRITPVTPFALRPAVQRATAGDRSERCAEERSRSSTPVERVHRSGTDEQHKDEPVIQRATAGDRTAHDDPEHPSVAQRKARAGGADGDADMRDAAARAIARRGPGAPLMPGVRELLESRMGVDLGRVRLHTGTGAERATAALGARAFTHGGDIWLGRGESAADTRLVAHEATHVVQQGAAAAQGPSTAEAPVQRLIPDWILEELDDYARHIPGWTLFTVIIGYNPLTRTNVERTATSLLGGVMGLVPFGTAIFDKLNEHGIVDDAFNWVRAELGRLDLSLGRIERTIEAAWEDVSLTSGFDYNMGVLRRHFGALYDDVVRFAGSLVDHVLQLIKDAVAGVAERLLGENRAWSLIKKILGRDPLRDVPVQATHVEILEDFLLLIGQEQHLQQMRERGKVEEAANWIATQIATFMGLLGELRGLVTRAWDTIQPSNLHNLMDNVRALAADAGGFLQRVWDFASTVAARVLEFIKQALLGWLASFANDVPGFHLLTVILGRNPFTGEAVPRTAVNLIRGFITLLPGGAAIYARLQETGTIARAAGRIEGAVEALGISWAFITGIFRGIWDTLGIGALAEPVATFTGIVDRFAEPVSRLFRFVGVVLREIISIVLEIMNFPSDLIGSIIANAMAAIEDIKRDPVGFLLNMLAAVKRGFSSFFEHIVTHLTAGLADWLFRGLRQAGIQPPRDFSLSSVLGFVMEVLGISVERIWQKLGERLGAERVARVRGAIDRLTGIWTFVRDVQQRGAVAIWEYIQTRITGLWDMVLQKAKDWIMERIVNRAIQWLMSLLDITGIMPVINSFAAFFRAVQSAIDYLRDILAIVNDYVMTLAAVARGEIAPGAQKIERGLANAIPVAIGFLANQFGLSNIGEKIQEIVGGLREMVDGALNWLIDRAVAGVQSLLASLGVGGGERAPGPDWTREKGEFDEDAEHHEVTFDGRNLKVASEHPVTLEVLLARREALQPALRDDQRLKIRQAMGIRDELAALTGQTAAEQRPRGPGGERAAAPAATAESEASIRASVREKLARVAALLAEGDLLIGQGQVPASHVTFSMNDGRAGTVTAEPLTIIQGNTTGANAGDRSHVPGIDLIERWQQKTGEHSRPNTVDPVLRSRVTGTHVLAAALHGPFDAWNVALSDQGLNNRMISGPEAAAKAHFRTTKLKFEARVEYFNNNPPPPEAYTLRQTDVETAKRWLGFYIAHFFHVTVSKWNGTAYGDVLFNGPIEGPMPPVQGQRIPPLRERIIETVKTRLTTVQSVVGEGTEQEITWVRTGWSTNDLLTELAVQEESFRVEMNRLYADEVLRAGAGRGARLSINHRCIAGNCV